VRFLEQGDETHLAMGVLAIVFTLATLVTTGRIYRTVESSISLQFENRDLIVDLAICAKTVSTLLGRSGR